MIIRSYFYIIILIEVIIRINELATSYKTSTLASYNFILLFLFLFIFIFIFIFIYIFIYICVCVCVCILINSDDSWFLYTCMLARGENRYSLDSAFSREVDFLKHCTSTSC